MRCLALALALAVACQQPAAAPSPSAQGPAAPVTERPSPTPLPAPTATPALASPSPAPAATAKPLVGQRIELHELRFAGGMFAQGAGLTDAGLALLGGATSAWWLSEWREPGFAFSRLIPSWNADTPEGSWIQVEVQTRRANGAETKWWSFGRWAHGDATIRRASVKGQRDADGDVDTDVLLTTAPMSAYRVRIAFARTAGSTASPSVRSLFVVASDPSSASTTIPSAPGPGVGKELPVPQYSQEIHAGRYPEYDGGGEAWCSPTSTAMVLAYWGKGPSREELSWVARPYNDPHVAHAARYTYDATYGGAGNWPFNTAYAARYGVRAFVTQLRSLTEAERFIAAGIPLVASVRIAPGALPGFILAGGSPGHLLVISGFTASGDVVSHDPAAWTNDTVRRVYPRAAFERAWLGGSQGTVYVIHPASTPLPARIADSTPNW